LDIIAFFASIPRDRIAGKKPQPYSLVAVTQIGGRGWRTFEAKSAILKPYAVTVLGKQWLENDPGDLCLNSPSWSAENCKQRQHIVKYRCVEPLHKRVTAFNDCDYAEKLQR
jgi:hypothetical protein